MSVDQELFHKREREKEVRAMARELFIRYMTTLGIDGGDPMENDETTSKLSPVVARNSILAARLFMKEVVKEFGK